MVPLPLSDCKSFWWIAANLRELLQPSSIQFCLGQNAASCLALWWVLGTFTVMSLDTVAQTILCIQRSKHFIQMIWDSRCMRIQSSSLVLFSVLKNFIPLKYFSMYLFIAILSQKKQPSSSWVGWPESQELLRKVKILQSHTDFVCICRYSLVCSCSPFLMQRSNIWLFAAY